MRNRENQWHSDEPRGGMSSDGGQVRRIARKLKRIISGCGRWRIGSDSGASIVEFAVAASIYFSLFFGVIEFCMAVYAYNFVSEAAREGSRYAVVRGSQSCTVSSTFPNCNLLPTSITSSTNNPVLTYIDSLGFPGLNANNLSAAVTWWEPTKNGSGNSSWTTTQCVGATDATTGVPCNVKGNMVKVVVTYNFPIMVPWWKAGTLPVTSTSEMMISE